MLDVMEGAVGRELSWDKLQLQTNSCTTQTRDCLCRAAPRTSGCSHRATSPKHPVHRSSGALGDKAKFLLKSVDFWKLREVGRSRAEMGF